MNTDALASLLEEASDAYYNGGSPMMTDAEFDALEARLRSLDPSNPVLTKIGSPVTSGWPKVAHPIPMGSLSKVQDDQGFRDWHGQRLQTILMGEGVCVSEKLDGISILLTYKDGSLVRAATRGDGVTGEDITRNVRVMQCVPPTIALTDTVLVRGEIVCLKSDFAKFFQGESNTRNTAAGTSKRQSNWQKARHLTLIAYNLFTEKGHGMVGFELLGDSRLTNFGLLHAYGFKTPTYEIFETDRAVMAMYEEYVESKRNALDYDIDGLVIEVNNHGSLNSLGFSPDGMIAKGAVALKFPHDSKQTTLRNIRWQTGPTGRVTPVAEFDTVDLAGVNVSNASLANASEIKRLVQRAGRNSPLNFFEGDTILVSRRNDVIPKVEALIPSAFLPSAKLLPIPIDCPTCGGILHQEGEYLVCQNSELCEAQILGNIGRWLGKTGVLHFGGSMVRAAVDAGLIQSLGDLYRIKEADLANLDMEGRKIGGAAKRALESLHSTKEMELADLVGSLGINLVGRSMIQVLVDAGLDDLNKLAEATEAQLAAIPGFGTGRAQAFRAGFDGLRPVIIDLLAAGVTIKPPSPKKGSSTGPLTGTSVCFTGVRDKALEEKIEELGGEIKGGVAKGLTFLVCKDVGSGSSKAQKAQSLGVKVISLKEMWDFVHGSLP